MNKSDLQGNPNRHKRSFRFSKTLWITLTLLGLCWAYLYLTLGHYSEEDKISYEKMIKGEEESENEETQVSKQRRIGLQKSIYFFDSHDQRHELKIISANSELALEKTGSHIEVVELLHDVICWLQENAYFILPDGRHATAQSNGRLLIKDADPKDPAAWIEKNGPELIQEQVILVIKAENAIYHYKGELFEAENVNLQRYIVPHHELDFNQQIAVLISEGSASEVNFSLQSNGIDLDAKQFKAKFSPSSQELNDQLGDMMIVSADHAEYNRGILTLDGNASFGYKRSLLSAHLIILEHSKENAAAVAATDVATGKVREGVIQNIKADGDVRMNYHGEFDVLADHAVFIRNEKLSDSKEPLPGMITLTMDSPDRFCMVTNQEGDVIRSADLVIDTITEDVVFSLPKGILKANSGEYGHGSPVEFSADRLVWNDPTSKLILSGNVVVDEQGVGRLQAVNDVVLLLTTVNGKKVLRGMETEGDAILTYSDPESALNHVLKSYGSLRINHLKMEAKLQSPEDAAGNVKEGLQVAFEDSRGFIFADKVFVKYENLNNIITPTRIVLQDNVKIANNLESSLQDKNKVNQYILADRVDFIPQTKEMIFKASKGRRVLFFDKTNSLEVSAPGMKLIRDIATNKDTVQGIGDVRFSFVEGELEQIRRHFSFEKDKDKEKVSNKSVDKGK